MKEKLNYFKENIKLLFKELGKKGTRIKQIPNLLTLSRLISPLIIIPLALSGNLLLVGVFTCLFGLTDLFDGIIARKYNVTSEFGRLLDACTDKVFAFSLILPLLFTNPILIINLILEGVISFVNVKSNINGNKPKTIFLGKIKTTLLFILLSLSYLSSIINISNLVIVLANITSLLQIGCAVEYKKIDVKEEVKKENNVVIDESNDKLKELAEEKKKLEDLKEYVIKCKENKVFDEKEKTKVLKK